MAGLDNLAIETNQARAYVFANWDAVEAGLLPMQKFLDPAVHVSFIRLKDVCIGNDLEMMADIGIEGSGTVGAGVSWSLLSKLPIAKEPLALTE